jgi:D-xylonolactonase
MQVTCLWNAQAELGEGARYDPDAHALWWVDILGRRIFRLDLDTGERRIWETPETVGCTFASDDGTVLALLRHSLVKLDPATGAFATVLEFPDEPTENRFNDGCVGPDGVLWAGSMDFDCIKPTGALYRVAPDGAASVADRGYIVVNGPAISADGARLYVNETMGGEVYCFDRDPHTNALTNKRVFARLKEGEGLPDGLCCDADGGLWVALVTGGCVRRYTAGGDVDLEIALPTPIVTSVTIGGRARKTLFITTGRILMDAAALAAHPLSGALFCIDIAHEGLPAARFRANLGERK